MEHSFTPIIKDILFRIYGENGTEIYTKNLLIQYINEKTKSASKGSKSRSSFANLYAIYVIIEDYIAHDFDTNSMYRNYEGAQFSRLFQRQRELPFGSKLQNHALNNRMNAEFQKFFPTSEIIPILRNLETNRYWINENLLIVDVNGNQYNIAKAIVAIIDEYVKVKQDSFQRFIAQCEELQAIEDSNSVNVHEFIIGLLAPNVDALKLYKTGRTNANDGGIDFVMKPLGRFFQVTETLDFKKYFLDIEKIEKYPITFVVKSLDDVDVLKDKLYKDASKTYVVEDIVCKYMECIEEIINIPTLLHHFQRVEDAGLISNVLKEIILQSRVEFNYEDEL